MPHAFNQRDRLRWVLVGTVAAAILLSCSAGALAKTSRAPHRPDIRARIVRLAGAELGYNEPGNFCTKFGPCEPWCSLFVTWVWRHAGISIPKLPFTGDLFDWARARTVARNSHATPLPGDAVLFGTGPWTVHSSVHVGIVEAVYPGYLVTIEGDAGHAVRRFVVRRSDPLMTGEPGPIYAYASPLGHPHPRGVPVTYPPALIASTAHATSATVAETAQTISQAPITNERLSKALELEGPRFVSAVRSLSAFQHVPFRSPSLNVDWTGLDRDGRVKLVVSAALTPSYAVLAWQRWLHRYGDPGSAYAVTYRTHPGVPVAFSAPAISGRAKQGQTLSVRQGGWANGPTVFHYQWQRCTPAGCAAIPGATGTAYRLTAADVGDTIRVQETAGNYLGTSTLSVSRRTGSVAKLPPPKPPPPPAPPAPKPTSKPAPAGKPRNCRRASACGAHGGCNRPRHCRSRTS